MINILTAMLYSELNTYNNYLGFETLKIFFADEELIVQLSIRQLSQNKKSNVKFFSMVIQALKPNSS